MRPALSGVALLSVTFVLGIAASTSGAERRTPNRSRAVADRPARVSASRPVVTVGAYCLRGGETASGKRVGSGMVALSPDLEKLLGVSFGDRVTLDGMGTYVFQDRMAARHRRRVDIFMGSTAEARRFGQRRTRITAMRRP